MIIKSWSLVKHSHYQQQAYCSLTLEVLATLDRHRGHHLCEELHAVSFQHQGHEYHFSYMEVAFFMIFYHKKYTTTNDY